MHWNRLLKKVVEKGSGGHKRGLMVGLDDLSALLTSMIL